MVGEIAITAPNSEYAVTLRSTQIASGRKLPTATSHIRGTLGASVGRPTTRQQTDRNEERKCQRFAKLKEVFCQRTSRHKNTTFNFTQPHPKPTHHPTM